jgi:hypothetical protein
MAIEKTVFQMRSVGSLFNMTTTASFPTAVCLALVQAFGAFMGRRTLPPGIGSHPGDIFSQLLSWDGGWYYNIAMDGYSWHPALSQTQYQNVAFFPLQAIIDQTLIFLAGQTAVHLILFVSFSAGIVSIFCFEQFARALVGNAAAMATVLYGFWPASSFYLMGYPTGMISICIISALHAHIENRVWVAALWLGIGSAAAPTVVFVATAFGLDHTARWVKGGRGARPLFFIAGWGAVALSGLLAFMIYQTVAFHDSFAFVEAQDAWGKAPGVLGRIRNLLSYHHYLQQPNTALQEIKKGRALIHAGNLKAGMVYLEFGAQRILNSVTFVMALIGLLVASRTLRGTQSVVSRAGWAVFAGYLWFIVATDQNLLSSPRLLWPAIALFLGLGRVVCDLPFLARVLIVVMFAVASCVEIGFVAVGAWVV